MAKKKQTAKKAQTKTQQPKKRMELGNEIRGLVLILLGVLLFICLVVHQESVLRKYIAPVLLGLFGAGAYVLPFILAAFGIACIACRELRIHAGKFSLAIAIVLSFMGIFQICFARQTLEGEALTYGLSLSGAYTAGIHGVGLITNLYAYPIACLVTVPGAIAVFAVIIVASVVALFNFSLRETGEKVGDKVKEGFQVAAEKRREKKQTNYDFRIAQEEEREKEKQAEKKAADGLTVTPFRSVHTEAEKPQDVFLEEQPAEGQPAEERPETLVEEAAPRHGITIRHYDSEIPIETEKNEPAEPEEEENAEKAEAAKEPAKQTYVVPPLALLNAPQPKPRSQEDHSAKIEMMESTLKSFGINAWVENITVGPAITRYELSIAPGTRVSRILSLSDDIALSMAAVGVRIEAPIPGKSAIGIEIPNESVSMVTLREVLESEAFKNSKSKVSVGLGKDITGAPIIADLSKMPHLLIAGQTGSGKSVCINSIITSILYKATPQEVRMILVDPKKVELNVYNGIPHLLTPVVSDPKKAAGALQFVVRKMEERYEIFARKKVKEITRYNEVALENGEEIMPRLVVIVDELNDLMLVAKGEVEDSVMRIAQLARAAGIYLILATQRPSVNVITGVIKANIPSRIAFAVASGVDSKTILDSQGAEKLVGKGDMLYHLNGESKPSRVQGAFVGEQEVERVVEFIKARYQQTDYIGDDQLVMRELKPNHGGSGSSGGVNEDDMDENGDDELFFDASMYAIECHNISISALQRRFKVGYARAGRLIDDMELKGIVEPSQGAKPRRVLMTAEEFLNRFDKRLD